MNRKAQITRLQAIYECDTLPEMAVKIGIGLNTLKAYINHEPVSYSVYETIQALLQREGIYA